MRWLDDLRFAARGLFRRPLLAFGGAATLGLGIGATTAVYSAVDALLVRSLPFPEADRLVRIESARGGQPGSVSYREVRDLRELSDLFVDVASYTDQGQYNASGDGRPEELPATITTQNLFRVLGVPLAFGAAWPEVLDHTRDFKLIISHELWQRRFGGGPDVLGRTMTLDGAPGYTIVGVLPPGFAFPRRADLYRSHGIAANPATYEDRANRGRWAIARLADGVSIDRARAGVTALAARLERDFPTTNTGIGFTVTPLRDLYLGGAGPYLALLAGAVVLVLLIASANVANLLLSRAVSRERELAVRAALGAGRGAIRRLLVAEGVLLASIGGALGLALAFGGTSAIERLIRADLPGWMTIDISGRVLVVAAAVTMLVGIGIGMVPAARIGTDLNTALRNAGRGQSGGRRDQSLRSALVVSEFALAVVVLTGAGLLVRSFLMLTRADPGFRSDNLLTFRVEQGWRSYPDLATTTRFQRELLGRLGALPGVARAALIDNLPFDGRPRNDQLVVLEGQDPTEYQRNPFVNLRSVSSEAFAVLEIPLTAGRTFTAADRDSALQVAIVSVSAARRLWPGRDPLGTRLLVWDTDSTKTPWRTVVGVVGDVSHEGPGSEPALDVYLPNEQWQTSGPYFLVKMNGSPGPLFRTAPELTWEIDPNQSFFDVRMMSERVADRSWIPRLAGVLFTLFGVLSAVLAGIGVSATLAFSVAQRTRELGVRQALGASRQAIVALVVRHGLRLTLLGGGIGLAVAMVLGLLLRRLLYGIAPLDLPTLIGVPLLLGGIAFIACWLPARRAGRVDPLVAIRAAE